MTKTMVRLLAVAVLVWASLAGPASADDYATMASLMATPLSPKDEGMPDAYSSTSIMLRMEVARQRLNAMGTPSEDLSMHRTAVLGYLNKCNSSMEELRRLDRKMPDISGIATKAIDATPALFRKDPGTGKLIKTDEDAVKALTGKVVEEAVTAVFDAWQASTERETYRTNYRAARSAAYELKKVAAARCKAPRPDTNKGEIIKVDFHGSWDGTFIYDRLILRNDSGRDLTNCTIAVDIDGTHGYDHRPGKDHHLHYIANWPAGEWRVAHYMATEASTIARDESVDFVKSLKIELFSDQYRHGIDHEYAGTEAFDRDVKNYFNTPGNKPTFYLKYSKDNFLSNAGVTVSHGNGLSRFPDPIVTVKVKDGVVEKSVRFRSNGGKWSSGFFGGQWLSNPDFNGLDPDWVEITLEFPGSTYKHTLTWNLSR